MTSKSIKETIKDIEDGKITGKISLSVEKLYGTYFVQLLQAINNSSLKSGSGITSLKIYYIRSSDPVRSFTLRFGAYLQNDSSSFLLNEFNSTTSFSSGSIISPEEYINSALRQNRTLTALKLHNQGLSSDALRLLLNTIKDTNITKLDLTDNEFGANGLAYIIDACKIKPFVSLNFKSCHVRAFETSNNFAELIKIPSLRTLNICNNNFYQAHDTTVTHMAAALSTNTKLTSFNISNCSLKSIHLAELIKGISHPKSILSHFYLSDNCFGGNGYEVLHSIINFPPLLKKFIFNYKDNRGETYGSKYPKPMGKLVQLISARLPTLRELNLSGTGTLNSEDIKLIGTLLGSNSNIKKLYLDFLVLEKGGETKVSEEIAAIVKSNSSLKLFSFDNTFEKITLFRSLAQNLHAHNRTLTTLHFKLCDKAVIADWFLDEFVNRRAPIYDEPPSQMDLAEREEEEKLKSEIEAMIDGALKRNKKIAFVNKTQEIANALHFFSSDLIGIVLSFCYQNKSMTSHLKDIIQYICAPRKPSSIESLANRLLGVTDEFHKDRKSDSEALALPVILSNGSASSDPSALTSATSTVSTPSTVTDEFMMNFNSELITTFGFPFLTNC